MLHSARPSWRGRNIWSLIQGMIRANLRVVSNQNSLMELQWYHGKLHPA